MTKLYLKAVCTLLLVLSSLMWGQYSTYAEDITDGTYSIKPVFGSDQNSNISNYFSIQTDKDIKGKYAVEITNNSDEPLTLTVETLNAFTSPYGLIQYAKGKSIGNSFIVEEEHAFTNYVDITDNITVKPNSVSTFEFEVNIPKRDGSLLGSISFRTISKGEQTSDSNVSIRINNEINNIIAFHADFGNDKFDIVEFGEASLFYSSFDTHITLPLKVYSNTVVENSIVSYAVYDENGEKIFDNNGKAQKVHLVPNIDFDLHIPWLANSMSAESEYTITGSLTVVGEENKVFSFSDKFKYEKTEGATEDAQMKSGVIMEDMSNLFDSPVFWSTVIFGSAVILMVLIKIVSARIMYKSLKKQEEENAQFVRQMDSANEVSVTTDEILEADVFGETVDEPEVKLHFIHNADCILDANLIALTVERKEIENDLLNNQDDIIVSTQFIPSLDSIEDCISKFPKFFDETEMESNSIEDIDTMESGVVQLCVHAIYVNTREGEHELKLVILPVE